MEDILQIEDIVESTLAPPFFLINFRVSIVGYVNHHKVVAKRSAGLEFLKKRKEKPIWLT